MVDRIKMLRDTTTNVIEVEGKEPNVKVRIKMTNKADNSVMEESLLNPMEFMQTYRQHLMNKAKISQQLKQMQSQLNDKVWLKWEEQVEEIKADVEMLDNEEKSYIKSFRACKSAIPDPMMAQLFANMEQFMNPEIAKLVPKQGAPNTRAAPTRK